MLPTLCASPAWESLTTAAGRYVFCGAIRQLALTPTSRTLSGTLLCGVRTFLPCVPRDAASGRPAQLPTYPLYAAICRRVVEDGGSDPPCCFGNALSSLLLSSIVSFAITESSMDEI